MSFNDSAKVTRSRSVKSRTRLSYQLNGQNRDVFTNLGTGSTGPRADYHCEIFYNGRVKIWNTISNHRFTVDYVPKEIVFESLEKRTSGGAWVHLDPNYDSWTPNDRDQPDTQLIVRILSDSPVTQLSRENDAIRNSLATANVFPLAGLYQNFARIKLQMFDASQDRDWEPETVISLITHQKLDHPRQEFARHDNDVIEEVIDRSEVPDLRMENFLDREEAVMKAEKVDSDVITTAMKAIRSTSIDPTPSSTYRLPVIPMFVGHGEAVRGIMPLAERGYAVDFSHFDDINPSQRKAIQNVFDYQVSLIHAPTGCAANATIVSTAEAILRKAPKSKLLICSISNAAADKIAEGFKTREHLCDFRFKYLRFLPRSTEDLKDVRVIVCTYAASGVERLTKAWFPQIVIADDAGRLRHYELIVPIAAHLDSLTRLVLVGDHIQHGPCASTELGKIAWEKSIFEKMVEERWPQQMLNVNYLTHSDLCYPTSLVFYRNLITASRNGAQTRPFATELLLKSEAILQIRDNDGGSANLTSVAHFVDVRSADKQSIIPEVSCVDIIVRALLSTNACKADQMMVVHGSREYQNLLAARSTSNGWSEVVVTNVASAQGLSRKVVILCLPRGESELQQSLMSQRRAVSVMMSLATDVCFVVGKWKSICELDHTNDLQRIMFCMDETVDDFLLRVGETPYTFGRVPRPMQ
ncbi:hypothetical protein H2200_004219 [Cladophialophora chaetospira]|uniref:DNA2/NAM7 helicase-like C-terminal domain-containing protein n=1 Tax=Cladophialophora chaetospira TaxID=386627 RepID=A0AA39CLH3_9EURO|nr:hypothetical protein H2200_004219 [Cladophialophora chaetospira]